jgi:hypothetical protein
MDSITQAALGAAVGHLCWQDKLGRKSLLFGAVAGTLPDLDIVLYPFLDDVQRLYWHRGESHSVWFVLLGTLTIGWLVKKFRSVLDDLDYEVTRQITSASPFNTLLWRHIAEVPNGFLLGYWSWLDDKEQKIHFQFIPQNAENIASVKSTRSFQAVEWFSKGWWIALHSKNNAVKVVDIRFTELPSAPSQTYTHWQWPFAWYFDSAVQNTTDLIAIRPKLENPVQSLRILAGRVNGQPGWVENTY